MSLPTALTQAYRQERLLALWGALPFPLAAQPPANRTVVLNRWITEAKTLASPALPLPQLPPLPLLSLDPTGRVEAAFAQANLPLPVVRTRRDVPVRGGHVLLKLAGDLPGRTGVILSRAELAELRRDPDKGHLLAEARRLVAAGTLLLLGCDPANPDFQTWWSVLAPALDNPVTFAIGQTSVAWPAGVTCLGPDLAALKAALWAARPEPEAAESPASFPPSSTKARYIINVYGPVQGLTIGEEARVEQQFEAPVQTVEGDWEALITQVTARLDRLSAQLNRDVADLKRGQAALYRQVDRAYRPDLARLLAAVQQSRLPQVEMQATLNDLRRAMRIVLNRGVPMDVELRAAITDLTEAVESSLSLERKLELALPLLPLLTYRIELGVGSELDLHDLAADLRRRWEGLVKRLGG